MDLRIVIGFITLLIALGALADYLLLHRHRTRLYTRLTAAWIQLDDTRVPNLARLAATKLLEPLSRLRRQRDGLLTLGVASLPISWLFTTLFWISGSVLDGRALPGTLATWPIYVINYPFDIVTAAVTVAALVVIRDRGFWVGVGAALGDALLAFMLALASVTALVVFATTSRGLQIPYTTYAAGEEWTQFYEDQLRLWLEQQGHEPQTISVTNLAFSLDSESLLKGSFDAMRRPLTGNTDPRLGYRETVVMAAIVDGEEQVYQLEVPFVAAWRVILTSVTTLVPTLVFVVTLLLLMIAKVVLRGTRFMLLHLLEVSLEKPVEELAPAKMLSLVLAMCVALLKVLSLLWGE